MVIYINDHILTDTQNVADNLLNNLCDFVSQNILEQNIIEISNEFVNITS